MENIKSMELDYPDHVHIKNNHYETSKQNHSYHGARASYLISKYLQ